jgi:hypothetical protein
MAAPAIPLLFIRPSISDFPPMDRWSLIRDYNKDGLPDIFTGCIAGIKVYRGSMSGGHYNFTMVDSPMVYPDGAFTVNIYCANDDLPAIEDMDKDGDLDILVFSIWSANGVLSKSIQGNVWYMRFTALFCSR